MDVAQTELCLLRALKEMAALVQVIIKSGAIFTTKLNQILRDLCVALTLMFE